MEIRFGRRDTHSEQQTKKKAGGKSEEKIFFFSMRSNGRVQLDKERQNTLKKKKNFLGNITNYISRGVHWSTKKSTPYYVIYKLTE